MDRFFNTAAMNGEIELLEHVPCSMSGTRNAIEFAAGNHLSVVKWLHETRTDGCTVFAMNCAAHRIEWTSSCSQVAS